MSGPSQPKVEGEQWSDERIKGFLDLVPRDETDADFYVLIQAYQYMTPEFFARFVEFFAETGRNINASSPEGETIFDRVSQHSKSEEYLAELTKHGAQASA